MVGLVCKRWSQLMSKNQGIWKTMVLSNTAGRYSEQVAIEYATAHQSWKKCCGWFIKNDFRSIWVLATDEIVLRSKNTNDFFKRKMHLSGAIDVSQKTPFKLIFEYTNLLLSGPNVKVLFREKEELGPMKTWDIISSLFSISSRQIGKLNPEGDDEERSQFVSVLNKKKDNQNLAQK